MEPIRVLHEDVIMNPGGIETLLMNTYRHIDRSLVQFDFMVHRPEEGFHEKEINELGGRVYHTRPFNPMHHRAYKNSIVKVFEEHPEYKVLHAHADLSGWPLKYAAKCGVPTRIVHSHNCAPSMSLKYFFFQYEKLWMKKYCTDMFMCSTPAGEWLFGKKTVESGKVRFIKNGVETDRYRFNEKVRAEVRRELNAGDKLVFCHVGRFMAQKNHKFLLQIFSEIHKQNSNTMLIMAGIGELKEECERLASELGISDSAKFLGIRGDVERLLQGADLFLLPSLWEGLPLTVVEAQSAGLPVVMSDVITKEVILTKGVKTPSLSDSAEKWSQTALELCTTYKRYDCRKEIIDAGFDICSTAKFLQDFYIERTMRALHSENK